MKNTPLILDTNSVIYFLTVKDVKLFNVVSSIINSTDCIVPLEVIAETVYTIERKINIPRAEIAELIQEFIGIRENMVQEENVVRFACNLFALSNFDFVDCILYGYSRAKGNLVLTFDSGLKRHLQNKAYNG